MRRDVCAVFSHAIALVNGVPEKDVTAAWLNRDKRVHTSVRPTCWVLDLGCTRSMGSRKAIEAFEKAVRPLRVTVM